MIYRSEILVGVLLMLLIHEAEELRERTEVKDMAFDDCSKN